MTMLDVGSGEGPEQPNPADSLNELMRTTWRIQLYFLGDHYESIVIRPGSKGEYYGFPRTRVSYFCARLRSARSHRVFLFPFPRIS